MLVLFRHLWRQFSLVIKVVEGFEISMECDQRLLSILCLFFGILDSFYDLVYMVKF